MTGVQRARPTFYFCGVCNSYHSARWFGDCRQDSARLEPEQLDRAHGSDGWDEIDMDEVDAFLERSTE